jgi:hypothetical protein
MQDVTLFMHLYILFSKLKIDFIEKNLIFADNRIAGL